MPISPERILYRDDHYLAVNKRAGELAVRGKGDVGELPLLDFLRREEPGLRPLNRLDFDTSGIMLFARTKPAFDAAFGSLRLQSHTQAHEEVAWEKTYETLVAKRMARSTGVIDKPLPARSGRGLIPAHTAYRVLQLFANSTHVEATILTGRHHQIRLHFAEIGHPLVNDLQYGDRKFNRVFIEELKYRKFFLHARKLRFSHPITKQEIVVEAPLPKPFLAILKRLNELL